MNSIQKDLQPAIILTSKIVCYNQLYNTKKHCDTAINTYRSIGSIVEKMKTKKKRGEKRTLKKRM